MKNKLYYYNSEKYKIQACTSDKELMKKFIKQIDGKHRLDKIDINKVHYDKLDYYILYESYDIVLNMYLEEELNNLMSEVEGDFIGSMFALDDIISIFKFDKKEEKIIDGFNELMDGYILPSHNGIRSLSLLENVNYSNMLKLLLRLLKR